eukprot:scaffold67735_cov24-Prasinocladus_malaysianus.AAC.1
MECSMHIPLLACLRLSLLFTHVPRLESGRWEAFSCIYILTPARADAEPGTDGCGWRPPRLSF